MSSHNPSSTGIGQPLFLEPIMVERVWGANRLGTLFEKVLPEGRTIGESWELADRAEEKTRIVGGDFNGRTIGEVMAERPEALLGAELAARKPAYFPLLAKYVDSGQPLSVQVHPDDDGARKRGLDDRGKCECWYIVHVEPGATIVRGVKPGVTRDRFERALDEGRVEELLHVFEPKVGDVVAIPPGMVHAIGAGLVIAEVQQNSDITYRVYDYNRVGLDGKPRALHVNASLDTINFGGDFGGFFEQDMASECVVGTVTSLHEGARRTNYLSGRYFDLHGIEVKPGGRVPLKAEAGGFPVVVYVVAGSGVLNGRKIAAGRTVLFPADLPADAAVVFNQGEDPMLCLLSALTADS